MIRSRILFILALAILAATTVCAQTYSVLDNFGGRQQDLRQPGSLVQGPDGALYGTSTSGGAYGQGAFFTLTPSGQVQTLYSFCAGSKCSNSAGAYPSPVTLMLRPDGDFVGFTNLGGALGGGTIFDVDIFGNLTVLYNFQRPQGIYQPLTVGADGQFYGIAQSFANCGAVITYANGVTGNPIQSLYSFTGNGPCQPTALVVGTDGNFYGTTYFTTSRGGIGCGTFFKLTLNGNFTLLHTFETREGCTPASLTLGNDGNFYGTSTLNNGIFKITPGGNVTVLQTLNRTEGWFIVPGLTEGSDGNFYGAASAGGNSSNRLCLGLGCGTLFQITPTGNFTVIHDFDFTTGGLPLTPPAQHTNGLFYGDASGGPDWENLGGVFYSLNDNLVPFVALTPYAASAGTPIEILGQGFTSSSTVSFNGTPATSVQLSSSTRLAVAVPSGATTGLVTVTTSTGTLTSNQPFIVIP